MTIASNLELQPGDEFNDIRIKLSKDDYDHKIDVSAGVYRDDQGLSYILPSVKQSKAILFEKDLGHDYNFCLGIREFVQSAAIVALGEDVNESDRVASCQTIGGTGACHLGAEFLVRGCNYRKFYLGTPTWPNYIPLIKKAGGELTFYNSYDEENKCVDFDCLMNAMKSAPPKSIFVLQLCCHNPTGTDLNPNQWREVAKAMKQLDLIPFIDGAYQGLATGSMDNDSWPVKCLIEQNLEFVFCQSFSKCLGLYAERVGCLHVVLNNHDDKNVVLDQLRYIFRAESSCAPAYGARIMATISDDPILALQWQTDLKNMSNRLYDTRVALYKLLTVTHKTPGNWDHLLTQRGLFWYSGLNERQCNFLVDEYHIYLPKNGRVNIAGLNASNIERFAIAFNESVKIN